MNYYSFIGFLAVILGVLIIVRAGKLARNNKEVTAAVFKDIGRIEIPPVAIRLVGLVVVIVGIMIFIRNI